MFGFTIIREKELMNIRKQSSSEFVRAFNVGYSHGRHDAIVAEFTPNQIRAALGLDPLPTESEEYKQILSSFNEATNKKKRGGAR